MSGTVKWLKSDSTRRLSIAGALAAGLAASSCCIGPLLLAVAGIGGAGTFALLGRYRYPMLAGAAVLLAVGFYLTYRRRPSADACGCERPGTKRRTRVTLWLAAILIALLALAPPIAARAFAGSRSSVDNDRETKKAVINVRGIDCEACATPLRRALSKPGGFHALRLDIPKQLVVVTYEPAPGRLEAYVAAIEELGYEASLVQGEQ